MTFLVCVHKISFPMRNSELGTDVLKTERQVDLGFEKLNIPKFENRLHGFHLFPKLPVANQCI